MTRRSPALVRLSHAVSYLRTHGNISSQDLANAAGISRNTLFLIERKQGNAKLSTVDRLATSLDVAPRQLFAVRPSLDDKYTRGLPLQATVARNIAYSRSRRAMTMRQLEQAAELPVGYASLIERTSPDLKVEMVERVANALDEKVSALLDVNFFEET